MKFGSGTGSGVLLMMCNTATYAASLVLMKKKMITHPYPFAITAFSALWSVHYYYYYYYYCYITPSPVTYYYY